MSVIALGAMRVGCSLEEAVQVALGNVLFSTIEDKDKALAYILVVVLLDAEGFKEVPTKAVKLKSKETTKALLRKSSYHIKSRVDRRKQPEF
jgi:hypothetical protein